MRNEASRVWGRAPSHKAEDELGLALWCLGSGIWGLLMGQGGGIGVQLWDGGPRWHVLELHFATDRLSWPSLQSRALGPESRALRTLGFCVTPLVHLFAHLPCSWAFSCQKFSGPG